jgi:hypothetical protein
LLITAWHCIDDLKTGGVEYNGVASVKVLSPADKLYDRKDEMDPLSGFPDDFVLLFFGQDIAPATMKISVATPGSSLDFPFF